MHKRCSWCGSGLHTTFYCRMKPGKPLKRKPISKKGKVYKQWMKTRTTWFRKFPASSYYCYLCGKRMTKNETTLDHVIPRSKAPELRYNLENLKPACWQCNEKKGSKVLEF